MNNEYQRVIADITGLKTNMLSLLHEWCHVNSGSYNLDGLAKMNLLIKHAFTHIADSMQTVTPDKVKTFTMTGEESLLQTGDVLIIRKRPHLPNRILLCGHMDTVYSPTHPFQTITQIDDNTLNGPGVSDMKGGLIVMLNALSVFEQTNLAENIGWDVIINADEEIGSIGSSSILASHAKGCQVGLVYEPSMTPNGTLAKNRRGSGKFSLIATGKAAHVGREFDKGCNAIWFLAEILCQIHKLNGKRAGLTINVGKVAGGEALNMVPASAVAKLDVRISTNDDKDWFFSKINEILESMNKTQGYSCVLHGQFSRPIKTVNTKTQLLFQKIQNIAKQLNLTLDWQDSGGCCDGNNLAQHGMAVIDTLGVRGGNIHSSNEYLLVDSLTERTLLSTLLLMQLSSNQLEGF